MSLWIELPLFVALHTGKLFSHPLPRCQELFIAFLISRWGTRNLLDSQSKLEMETTKEKLWLFLGD